MENIEKRVEELTASISSGEQDLIRRQAEIAGWRAERDSLAAALAARQVPAGAEPSEPLSLQAFKTRTDALFAILHHSGRPMNIEEIRATLIEQGKGTSTDYQSVASTLSALARKGLIRKTGRGEYAAA